MQTRTFTPLIPVQPLPPHPPTQSLLQLWDKEGGFDGLLGFSNGAAAAFLLAAHLQQDMVWRCGRYPYSYRGVWGSVGGLKQAGPRQQALPRLSSVVDGAPGGDAPCVNCGKVWESVGAGLVWSVEHDSRTQTPLEELEEWKSVEKCCQDPPHQASDTANPRCL